MRGRCHFLKDWLLYQLNARQFILTTFTVQPVFIWSYLCIGRLISNLITRERKMLFFERCALPWMKVTLAYQDKLTNTLNLKKERKKGRFIFLAKCGGIFCSYLCVYSLTMATSGNFCPKSIWYKSYFYVPMIQKSEKK